MITRLLPADACDPQLPGCDYHASPAQFLGPVALVLLGLGLLMLVAGAVTLIVFLIHRSNPTTGAPPSGATAPPGWFPDPSDNNRWRWWDGHSWTSDVSDRR